MAEPITIRLSRLDANRYTVDLSGPAVGETRAEMAAPFDAAAALAVQRLLEPTSNLSRADKEALTTLGEGAPPRELIGRALAGSLFADEDLRADFDTALSLAAKARQPLPVELRFAAGSDELAALPWEQVYNHGVELSLHEHCRFAKDQSVSVEETVGPSG